MAERSSGSPSEGAAGRELADESPNRPLVVVAVDCSEPSAEALAFAERKPVCAAQPSR